LVPARFLARTPFARLEHLVRYLRAVQIRAERAVLKPAKDAERALQIAHFKGWENKVPPAGHERFRWLLEEFRVSVFAQELGTAESVSAAKLKSLGQW
jgi:ATP-dependent helicase HrpA